MAVTVDENRTVHGCNVHDKRAESLALYMERFPIKVRTRLLVSLIVAAGSNLKWICSVVHYFPISSVSILGTDSSYGQNKIEVEGRLCK